MHSLDDVKQALKALASSLFAEMQEVLQQLQSSASSSSLTLLRTYCLAVQGYLQHISMQSPETIFPSWMALLSLHPSPLQASEWDEESMMNEWQWVLKKEDRDMLVDELSLLESFVQERQRQLQSVGMAMCADSTIERTFCSL